MFIRYRLNQTLIDSINRLHLIISPLLIAHPDISIKPDQVFRISNSCTNYPLYYKINNGSKNSTSKVQF